MVEHSGNGADAPLSSDGESSTGVDRRSALRKIGAGAGLAWAAPAVVAVGAPSPAAAQSVSCGCSLTYAFGDQISDTTRMVVFTLTSDCPGEATARVYSGPDSGSLTELPSLGPAMLPLPPVGVPIPCGESGRVDVVITDPTTQAVLCTTSTGFGTVECARQA